MHLYYRKHAPMKESPPHGDSSLIAFLYQSYAAKILAYLRLHTTSKEDADDLLLEVFLAALEREKDLAVITEDEQRAWLWRVARNKAIDCYRRHRHHNVSIEHVAEIIYDDDERTPERITLRDEEHALLHACLTRLSISQQEVVLLRFASGLRCAEIASILKKREGAIRTLLSRSLNSLRAIYKDQ